LQKQKGQKYLEIGGLSMLEWALNYSMFHVLLLGMGLAPRFFDTIATVAFAALASILPVNSFGNFGTQEAGWAAGMMLLGYPQETALTSGFATHLLTLLFMLVLGGLALLSYAAWRASTPKPLPPASKRS
jgi:uncharacterized membrane protein YbhN (UPF0104 family)